MWRRIWAAGLSETSYGSTAASVASTGLAIRWGSSRMPGPDGRYLTGDEPLADFNASITQFNVKGSWQLSKGQPSRWRVSEGNEALLEPWGWPFPAA